MRRLIPDWLRNYERSWLSGDLIAGAIVAIMLVPQAMGYALIAGLPPQVGLYASIVPLVLYAWWGSSRVLAVGPVALVSLLVGTAVADASSGRPDEALRIAIVLALGAGVLQVVLAVLRAGFVVNFLSHPVISGFTSAAALVIGVSQLKHLLGVSVPRADAPYEMFVSIAARLGDAHPATWVVGALAVVTLLLFRYWIAPVLTRRMGPGAFTQLVSRGGALFVLVVGTALSAALGLAAQGVAVVGAIPAGLPDLTLPVLGADAVALLPAMLAIGFVGYMESYAVAHALAARRRERVSANRELVGLGMANVGAAFTGGYPVTGGFSRSVVNDSAGANTALASIVSASLVALTVAFFTPLLHDLPMAVLAAVILVAVASLVDVRGAVRTWRYSRLDGASLAVTFVTVLALGIEAGIAVGAGISLLFLIARSSRPHIARVGRVPGSEHFRNVLRHDVEQSPAVLALRMDESLHFANTRALEHAIVQGVAAQPRCEHVLLIFSAINFVDSSGLECLRDCRRRLDEAGVTLSLAEVKGPVADKLASAGFLDELGAGRVFLSTDLAWRTLAGAPAAAIPPVAQRPSVSTASSS